jgi:hypothetical protein
LKLGGSVWHSSVARIDRIEVPEYILKRKALEALQGVGNSSLGEWHEWAGRAYHIRRRLNASEELIIGQPIDLRQTDEAMRRFNAMMPFHNDMIRKLALTEINEPRICSV